MISPLNCRSLFRCPFRFDGIESHFVLFIVEFLVRSEQRHTNSIENEKRTVYHFGKRSSFGVETTKFTIVLLIA